MKNEKAHINGNDNFLFIESQVLRSLLLCFPKARVSGHYGENMIISAKRADEANGKRCLGE
jgi:hypothetical protein